MTYNPEDKANKDINSEIVAIGGMYENWFLDYASYVILERAVPSIEDGFKPVQRRIMHAMYEMEDGRYNKVANVIGQSMQYHPHGDASITDAMVNMGQKDLLIDTQGNWGDIRTGDPAAAARYIEARLSKFALDIVFNPQTTNWQLSYDGRKREPLTLPVKFPLLLAQGVDGIAVGLSTRVLPHNFCELIKASIDTIKNKKVTVYPDFLTGGMVDISNYNEGKRGGKVRVRARIEELDKKTLIIKEIPFSTTTSSLIDSILKANDNGKIKIKKVEDNTAKDVEIVIHLAPGVSPDVTIDALYAFTDCEISISPNCCVIINQKPHFIGVNDLLKITTEQTMALLKRELEIKLAELEDDWHHSSLEKIFIEKRIYRDIEECETWEAVIATIHLGLKKYKKLFFREITDEDVAALTEIKIKRISKYDSFKADEHIKAVEENIKQVKYDLDNLKDYAIKYFETLLKKYGVGRERRTELKQFDTIKAQAVALANQKLYMNRADGFIGYGLKKDEFVTDCSDLDDIIVFREDGKMVVTRVAEKTFVGKNIIHIALFKKNDERTTYHMVYRDGKMGNIMVKRFNVSGITRDKDYDLTKGNEGSKVHYFSVNPNSESEIIKVELHPAAKARIKEFDYDFSTLEIKGRSSQGNILTRYPLKKIKLKEKGAAQIIGTDIWYDSQFGRFNIEQKGKYLGKFHDQETILVIYKDGNYELSDYELTHRIESEKVILIEKFNAEKVISLLYYDASVESHYIKRFVVETQTTNKKFNCISESEGSKIILASSNDEDKFKVSIGKKRSAIEKNIVPQKFVEVKGWKAIGNKLTGNDLQEALLLEGKKKLGLFDQDLKKDTTQKKEASIEVKLPEPKLSVSKEANKIAMRTSVKKIKSSKLNEDLFSIPKLKDTADAEWEVKPSKVDKKNSQKSLFD
jgi:topoisomerase-4 subunit A